MKIIVLFLNRTFDLHDVLRQSRRYLSWYNGWFQSVSINCDNATSSAELFPDVCTDSMKKQFNNLKWVQREIPILNDRENVLSDGARRLKNDNPRPKTDSAFNYSINLFPYTKRYNSTSPVRHIGLVPVPPYCMLVTVVWNVNRTRSWRRWLMSETGAKWEAVSTYPQNSLNRVSGLDAAVITRLWNWITQA